MTHFRRQILKSGARGFTLIELMIVIAIIGILVAVGIPAYQAITRAGNEAAAIKTLQNIAVNQRLYIKQKNGSSYGTFDQLITEVNLEKDQSPWATRCAPAAHRR